MKINIENYLHKIDNSFKYKSKKDIQLTYIMIVSVIFALSYFLFWDSSEKNFLDQNKQINLLNTKMKVDKAFLTLNPSIKISLLEKEIEDSKNKMIGFKDKNDYIKKKIEDISSLIYDERTWGNYINSISVDAKKYGIKISEFKNTVNKGDGSFGHILDLDLKVSGNYENTLKFINALETNDLVVNIHHLSIKAQDKLRSELKISVWGITY